MSRSLSVVALVAGLALLLPTSGVADVVDIAVATPISVTAGQELTGVDAQLVGSVADATFYVATNGTDTPRPACPGGMRSSPWRSIEHGMRCLRPGDTLLIRGGTYTERANPVIRPGTPTAPVRVAAYPGETVTIKGLVRLAGADYWSLEGVNITSDGKPYSGGEFLVKMREGVGWDLLNLQVTDAHSYGAIRVETASEDSHEPADWRIADSCVARTHPTHAPYRDHNMYVATGLQAGAGVIERNLLFGATNGQNIKLGAGNGPAGGTANVTVRYNTLWRAVQNVLSNGPSHGNVLERNLLGGLLLPAGKPWYPSIRGFDLDGKDNVARDNLGVPVAGQQHLVFNDGDSSRGWRKARNAYPVDAKVTNTRSCEGFQVGAAKAKGYGHLARTPHDDYPQACPEDDYPRNLFTDDDASFHEVAIDCLAWDRYGIARGVNAGQFRPAGKVRRDQMASFVVRLLADRGVDLPLPDADEFSDDGDSAHEESINRLATAGIVGGVDDERYAPGRGVTRGQMATFLARAYEYAAGSALPVGPDRFTDDRTSVHEDNVNRVANAGIAQGVGGSRYAPSRVVTREQMATFLVRTLERLRVTP